MSKIEREPHSLERHLHAFFIFPVSQLTSQYVLRFTVEKMLFLRFICPAVEMSQYIPVQQICIRSLFKRLVYLLYIRCQRLGKRRQALVRKRCGRQRYSYGTVSQAPAFCNAFILVPLCTAFPHTEPVFSNCQFHIFQNLLLYRIDIGCRKSAA